MTERLSINDPRLNWEVMPPLIAIDGLKYYLLAQYVANRVLQVINDSEKTITPIALLADNGRDEMLDFIYDRMLLFEMFLCSQMDHMTVFSSSGEISELPYKTKRYEPPRFDLVNGLWHPVEDGEYEDVFCCMEMVPIACSIRFKSLLPA